MLTLYPPALLPIDYPSRLLRLCLGKLSPLLEPRPQPSAGPIVNGGGKRGKKRARGAEDGLVGGLEGRDSKSLGDEEIEVVLESLRRSSYLRRLTQADPKNSNAIASSDSAALARTPETLDPPSPLPPPLLPIPTILRFPPRRRRRPRSRRCAAHERFPIRHGIRLEIPHSLRPRMSIFRDRIVILMYAGNSRR